MLKQRPEVWKWNWEAFLDDPNFVRWVFVHFVVVGEDCSGKSTALRALVGEEVVTGKGIYTFMMHKHVYDFGEEDWFQTDESIEEQMTNMLFENFLIHQVDKAVEAEPVEPEPVKAVPMKAKVRDVMKNEEDKIEEVLDVINNEVLGMLIEGSLGKPGEKAVHRGCYSPFRNQNMGSRKRGTW